MTHSNDLLPLRQHSVCHSCWRYMVFGGLALIFIGGTLCVVFWFLYTASDNSARRWTTGAFAAIAYSLGGYDHLYGHLPFPVQRSSAGYSIEGKNGDGVPLYSWRAVAAPLELTDWSGVWDKSKPWNDAANKAYADHPWRYSYDARHYPQKTFSHNTNAVAITGPGTAFGDGIELPKSLKDIPASVVLVVEVRNSGIHWMQPGDFDIRSIPHTINAPNGNGVSSRYHDGFPVIFADGQVWFLSNKVPFTTLEYFFTITGAKSHDREQELGPYAIDRQETYDLHYFTSRGKRK